MLVVKAKIKEAAVYEGKNLNVSGDFADKLDQKVMELVKEACRRAAGNGRSTVMAKDL